MADDQLVNKWMPVLLDRVEREHHQACAQELEDKAAELRSLSESLNTASVGRMLRTEFPRIVNKWANR